MFFRKKCIQNTKRIVISIEIYKYAQKSSVVRSVCKRETFGNGFVGFRFEILSYVFLRENLDQLRY